MSGEMVIGTARIDIEGDVSGLLSAVDVGKRSVSSMSAEAQQAYQQMNTAEKRRVDTLVKQADTIGMTRAQQIAYNAALKGVPTAVLDELVRKLDSARTSTNHYTMSAAQQTAAMRMVPAQITDIVVSLSTGQRPLSVLLQQGGQLKDMFGGVVPAARALGSSLVGLINPYVMAAAAVVGLTAAYVEGSSEGEKFARATILTGGYAGIAASQYVQMSQSIAQTVGTHAAAAEALEKVAATGKVAGDQVELIGKASQAAAQLTDVSLDDMIKRFVELGDSPAKASAALNAQYHYLTESVYEQIQALEKQGRQEEAAALAQKTYANAVIGRVGDVRQSLGWLESAWLGVKDAAKSAWDGMLSLGRDQSLIERIQANNQRISMLQRGIGTGRNYAAATGNTAATSGEIERLRSENTALQQKMLQEKTDATRRGQAQKTEQAGIEAARSAADMTERYASKQQKLNKALDDYHRSLGAIRKANPNSALLNPDTVAQTEKGIRDSFKDRSAKPKINVAERAGAQYMAEIEATRANIQQEIDNLTKGIDLSKLTEAEKKINDLQAQQRITNPKYRKGQATDADIAAEIAELKEQIPLEQKLAALRKDKEVGLAITSGLDGLSSDVQKYVDQLYQEEDAIGATSASRKEALILLQMEAKERELINQAAKKSGMSSSEFKAQRPNDTQRIHESVASLSEVELEANDRHEKLMTSFSTGWSNAFSTYVENAQNAATQAASLFQTMSKGMESSLMRFFATGKLGWKDFAASVLTEILRIETAKLAAGLISSAASFFTGGSDAGAAGASSGSYTGSGVDASRVGSISFHAKGDAFDGGQIMRYANGGAFTNAVVSSPTIAPRAMFGEAGPEAIMPLTRDASGRLGVHAAGAGGGMVMLENNFYIDKAGNVSQNASDAGMFSQMSAQMGQAVSQIVRSTIFSEMQDGGMLASAYRGS